MRITEAELKSEYQTIMAKIIVNTTEVSVLNLNGEDYICITDMMKAKDGEFFVTDWLRNRNTLESGKKYTIRILIMANSP